MVAEIPEQGIIMPSNSPFASPVILVEKKDQTWRLYVMEIKHGDQIWSPILSI